MRRLTLPILLIAVLLVSCSNDTVSVIHSAPQFDLPADPAAYVLIAYYESSAGNGFYRIDMDGFGLIDERHIAGHIRSLTYAPFLKKLYASYHENLNPEQLVTLNLYDLAVAQRIDLPGFETMSRDGRYQVGNEGPMMWVRLTETGERYNLDTEIGQTAAYGIEPGSGAMDVALVQFTDVHSAVGIGHFSFQYRTFLTVWESTGWSGGSTCSIGGVLPLTRSGQTLFTWVTTVSRLRVLSDADGTELADLPLQLTRPKMVRSEDQTAVYLYDSGDPDGGNTLPANGWIERYDTAAKHVDPWIDLHGIDPFSTSAHPDIQEMLLVPDGTTAVALSHVNGADLTLWDLNSRQLLATFPLERGNNPRTIRGIVLVPKQP